ncbi:MAG: caspase family protein [Ferruginibacter sp.]
MKAKLSLAFFLVLFICSTISAQSVFHLKYRFTNIDDTTTYNAFLVRFDDGTGFYRVRFFDDETRQEMIVELPMEEHYFVEKDGYVDSAKLYFKGHDPKIIAGDKTLQYFPERFWFKENPQTGIYEPWAVTSPDDQKFVAQGKFLEADLLDLHDLTKELVLQYFTEEDGFYDNLFETTTRGLTSTEKATKIYLVAVANTEDDDIGTSCLKDQTRNIKTFTYLAEYLGIQIVTKTIAGGNYSKVNVENAINSLNPSPKDIVVFCYSGHGFTIPAQNRKFPNLDLRPKPSDSYLEYYKNVEDIFMAIKNKGARFNLVISDCCNNDPNSSNTVGSDIAQTRSSGLGWSMENCRNLFMNEKPMSILMTSASVGEKASGNTNFGGFFSYYFKVAMENYFSQFKTNVTWDEVLQDAKKQTISKAELTYCDKPYTPQNICKQHPFYKIL